MVDADLIRYLNYQAYNIMPYGPAFAGGCMVSMFAYVEVSESWFGIGWMRFWKLVLMALILFAVLPISSYTRFHG